MTKVHRTLAVVAAIGLLLSACAIDPVDSALRGDDAAGLYGQMSNADVELAVAAMLESLSKRPTGEATAWENPATGNSGAVIAGMVSVTNQGVFCRAFEEQISVGGLLGITTSTACRDAEGVWQLAE